MIDFGFVIAAFVPLVLYWIFGDNHLRAVWRLSLGLGVIPALAVLVWRIRMQEPERFKRDSMKHVRIPYWLVLKRYGWSLAAISTTWFIYDFITYPVRPFIGQFPISILSRPLVRFVLLDYYQQVSSFVCLV